MYDAGTMPDQTLTADSLEGMVETRPTDPTMRARELAILDALRSVVDPEIGMNVVELALIRQILLGDDETEIKMILTTPFCPYAGSMIQQVKDAAEEAVALPVRDAPGRALGPARRRPDVVSERP